MLIVGLVLAGVAALIHVYIFVLESVRWTHPRTRAIFGVRSEEEAETTRALAFNQGFYNLFLAIEIALGIVIVAVGKLSVGVTLVYVGTGSMILAGLVLLLSRPGSARSALIQALPALLAVIALTIGLATR